MAEQTDLKQLYTSTFPTEERLNAFSRHLKLNKTFTRATFLETTNRAFAILGHFPDLDFSKPFDAYDITLKYRTNIPNSALEELAYALQKLKILNEDFLFNQTAIPMIQRYEKIFTAYEQQNGIENPLIR